MTKEIVISSYKEDILWISNIGPENKIFIYNKGGYSNTIPLPNVGREAHTYLHHICFQYGNFSDYIFFFQGNPFDHTRECLNIINSNKEIWNNNVQMYYDGYWGYAHNSSGTMWNLDESTQFKGQCLKCNIDGTPHHIGLPIKEVWDNIFESEIPDKLEFIPGNQFNVHKDLIYNRPLSFWEKLYNMSKDIELFPWIFERITPYILNNNFKIKI